MKKHHTTTTSMKAAVTVWDDRVSPVFDVAHTLLIAEIEDQQVCRQHYQRFDPAVMSRLIHSFAEQGIACLVCGAVSQEPAELLEAAGIKLIPFIAGNIDDVLQMLVCKEPEWTEMKMPGCGRGICCKGKIRRSDAIQPVPADVFLKNAR